MKKNFCAFIFIINSYLVFSLGAGLQISGTPSFIFDHNSESSDFAMGASVSGTFKFERIPFVISSGFDFSVPTNDFLFGMDFSLDYIFFENQLHNNINLYCGTGIGSTFLLNKNFSPALNGEFRALIGINFHFYTGYLEFYFQQVVSPLINYKIENRKSYFGLDLPLETGLRWHF